MRSFEVGYGASNKGLGLLLRGRGRALGCFGLDLGGVAARLAALGLTLSRSLFGILGCGALAGGGTSGTTLALVAVRRGPERQVVPEELHDQSAVPVGLLGQGVELGNGVIEGGLGQVAGTVRRVQDLVVEDGEVESQAKPNGMRRGELRLGHLGSVLVGSVSSPGLEGKDM